MPVIEGSRSRGGKVNVAGATGAEDVGYGPYLSAGAPTTAFNTIAEKGALCIDTTNAKLYINTGTKASNTWTVVGTQT
jgi:hypothetical protein